MAPECQRSGPALPRVRPLAAYFIRSSPAPGAFSHLSATLRSPQCKRPSGRPRGCTPVDGFLRAASETRAQVYALALDPEKGWMDRSEVRRLENLAPEVPANA
jgi:hypothetical protein